MELQRSRDAAETLSVLARSFIQVLPVSESENFFATDIVLTLFCCYSSSTNSSQSARVSSSRSSGSGNGSGSGSVGSSSSESSGGNSRTTNGSSDSGPDFLNLCNIADHRLYKIVKWCKSLPLFKNISVSRRWSFLAFMCGILRTIAHTILSLGLGVSFYIRS